MATPRTGLGTMRWAPAALLALLWTGTARADPRDDARRHFVLGLQAGRPGTDWGYALVNGASGTFDPTFSATSGSGINVTKNGTGKYTVAFSGEELWGRAAEPGLVVHVDLFEPYLSPEPA